MLPVLFHQLVDSQPGSKAHVFHPPMMELGPAVAGDEDEDYEEEEDEGGR